MRVTAMTLHRDSLVRVFSSGCCFPIDWLSAAACRVESHSRRTSLRASLSERRVRSIGHACGFEPREIDDEGFRFPPDGVRWLEKGNDRDDTSTMTRNLG